MIKYIFKRILFFIPTLLAISLLTFFISINAPGDPVEILLNQSTGMRGYPAQTHADEREYETMRHKLGLDLPLFYFSLSDATVSDTIYKIPQSSRQELLKRLANKYGNWENASAYYLSIKKIQAILDTIKIFDPTKSVSKAKIILNDLFAEYDEKNIRSTIHTLGNIFESKKSENSDLAFHVSIEIKNRITALTSSFQKLIKEKKSYKKYIPAIHWHGGNNQYHHWLVNFIKGDFGISYKTMQPVKTVLYSALGKTLSISLLSMLLAYFIAIPLGIYTAMRKNTGEEKVISTLLYILYSLPNFWIATMLVIFFCGGDYLSWFPSPGAPPIPEDASFWYKFSESIFRLILPLFCWTYGSIAFISRQMRGGIIFSLTQDYIQTARSKGMNEKQIVWKHAVKNSLLPILTLFADIFPFALSGAFVIETIFNIPGMGKLSLESLYARDYPVIFSILMLTAILTMLGYLISDIFYAIADPKILYKE